MSFALVILTLPFTGGGGGDFKLSLSLITFYIVIW